MDQLDKLEKYRRILTEVMEMHAKMPGVPETVEGMAVCDSVRDQYLLLDSGWYPNGGRAHDVVIHVRIVDGKVVIERDGIEYGISQDLLDAGISPEDIIFATDLRRTRRQTERLAA